MPDLDTFDKTRTSVTLLCIVCRWKFRCPVEQLGRLYCRACESNARERTHAVPKAT